MTLPRFSRVLFTSGCALGLVFMTVAAYAAHALAEPARAVDQALLLHAAHVPAILAAALLARPLASLAGAAFTLGTVLFCGSIYANHLATISVQAAAPAGGVVLMVGWVLLLIAGTRASGRYHGP